MKPSTEWWRHLAPLAVIAIIALLPLPAGWRVIPALLCRFTGVIVGLILDPCRVPWWRWWYIHHRHSFAGCCLAGAARPAVLSSPPNPPAVSGFLIQLSGLFSPPLCLVRAMKTGLGRRIALILVKNGASHAVSRLCSDVLRADTRACNTVQSSARGAGIIYPIIRNLPPLYQSQPNDSSSRSMARTSCGWGLLPIR